MLKNYIKIAFRKLLKNKVDSAISIGGLAIGIACCILLALSVRFELTYDNFHKQGDRLFRVTQTQTTSKGKEQRSLIQPYPMATALDSTFPEIDQTVRLQLGMVQIENHHKFQNQKVLFAGPAFFSMFSFPLVSGNKQAILSDPNSIVLSQSMAQRYFDGEQAIGKSLTLRLQGKERLFQVTGIAKDVPKNSSIKFKVILPFESLMTSIRDRKMVRQSWYMGNAITWVLLDPKANRNSLESKFPRFVKAHFGSLAKRANITLGLQPLNEVYFDQNKGFSIASNSDIQYTIILGIVGFIILTIAGINFMSLTLSRISGRLNEMGVRKAAGAQRKQLCYQIFGEVFITCGIALLGGMMLAELAAPYFQQVTHKPIPLEIFGDPGAWLVLGGILFLITLLTGIYPAFVIVKKKAFLLFRSPRTANKIPVFVKGLIVAQFALSIAFLIATFTLRLQMQYVLNKDLGFSSSNVISVDFNVHSDQATQKAKLFAREARHVSGIQSVAMTSSSYNQQLAHGGGMTSMIGSTHLEALDNRVVFELVDEHFLETMDIPLLKGQNFSYKRKSGIKNGILVNRQFVKVMGWHDPVGKVIEDDGGGNSWQGPLDGKKVIGVIGDYNFQPLYKKVQPLVLEHLDAESRDNPATILVKVKNGAISPTISRLRKLWDKVLPHEVFNYAFLDDLLAQQYQTAERWRLIMKLSSMMAILLACFGLFGLAALASQRRTKEIGIRKVMGATVANIIGLLSKDFLTLVVLGFMIAIPIAWYAMHRWLANFAYHIDIGIGIFALAGAVALFIAIATVSWQSIRAALANPVESLRNE